MRTQLQTATILFATLATASCATAPRKRGRALPFKTISQAEMDAAGMGCKESDYMLGHALSADGISLFTASNVNGLTWNLVSGKPTRRFKKYRFGLGALKWHPDGKHLLIPHLGKIVVADMTTGVTIRELETDTDHLPDAAKFTRLNLPLPEEDSQEIRDGENLGSGFSEWESGDGTIVDETCVSTARPSGDGQHVIGIRCDATGGFFVWDFESGKLLSHTPGIRMKAVATVPGSERIAFATKSEGILILDDYKSRIPAQLPVAGETTAVAMCTEKPDIVAFSTKKEIIVMNSTKGTTLATFPARKTAALEFMRGCLNLVVISGNYPATHDDSKALFSIYDLRTRVKTRELEVEKTVGISLMPTQEEIIVTYRDGIIRELDLTDWSVKRELRHPLAKDKPTECRIDD